MLHGVTDSCLSKSGKEYIGSSGICKAIPRITADRTALMAKWLSTIVVSTGMALKI